MTTRPFHHGNLREVLLAQAEVTLRNSGVDGLSLRELARQAGVSHGAPRSHFIDRQALLDALIERGFDRLTQKVRSASRDQDAFEERFRHVGRAYIEFAVDNATLMELMFAAKSDNPVGPLHEAAARLFHAFDEVMDNYTTRNGASDDARYRFQLLFAATMQGTATLIAARRIARSQGDVLVDDAIDLLLGSELGARVLPIDEGAKQGMRVEYSP